MHPPNQFDLLRERRFAPFFWTQFLGAGNDNVFKNAFVVFVTFEAATATSLDATTIVNLIGAVFILPFMLFSATAGQLADKLEKSRLIRWIKLFEIAIMAIAALGFWWQSIPLLFTALALLGIHSTLFGPVKYAILPQHLRPEELIGGNGLVEMGTFVAILLGTIAGGLVVAVKPWGLTAASIADSGHRRSGLAREPRDPADARGRARALDQLESAERDLAQPEDRSRERRRLALDARHLVVLVLRRASILRSCPRTRATCWAVASMCSRCSWPCSPWASVSVRSCARSCRGAGWRSAWCPSDRSGSRCSRSTSGSRAAISCPQSDLGRDDVPRPARALARARRRAAAGRVRRLLHRCRCTR